MAIGLAPGLSVYTDIDAWMLLRRHLDELPFNYYRPLGNPAKHLQELLKHFAKCKDELISPQDYLAYAEGVTLDNDDSGEERSRLSEVAHLYHAYSELLLSEHALDFGDLIMYACRLLTEREEVRVRLGREYRCLLVDEFQDVNAAQYQLTRLLSPRECVLLSSG